MHISVKEGEPTVIDVPEGFEIIFLCKYTAWNTSYCVILAPKENIPKTRKDEFFIEGAKLSVVDAEEPGNEMELQKVDSCLLKINEGGFVRAGLTAVEFSSKKEKGHFMYYGINEVYKSC